MDVATANRIACHGNGHVDAIAAGPAVYAFDGYRLAVGPRELSRGGRILAVPLRVFDCLVYLVEHRDRAVGRDELVAAVWGRVDVSDAQLGQIVLRARRVVGDDGNGQRLIRTMPKFGYRWMAPVEVSAADARTAGQRDAPTATAAASGVVQPARSPRKPLLALLASGLLAATAFGMARPRGDTDIAIPGGQAAIVSPVDVAARPGEEWIRLGGMDVLAARLRAGGLQVPASDGMLALLASSDGAGADARLRRIDPAAWIVRARLIATDLGWRADLAATSADGGALQAGSVGREPLTALRQAGDRLLVQLGREAPPVRAGPPGQLQPAPTGTPATGDSVAVSSPLQRVE